MSVVSLATLLVNAVCELVLEDWAVEGVVAEVPDIAGVQAMVEGATVLVTALQGVAVCHLVDAVTAGHHHITVAVMNHPMLMEALLPDIGAVVGVENWCYGVRCFIFFDNSSLGFVGCELCSI